MYKNDLRNVSLSIDREEDYCFKIEPSSGYFEKGEVKEFIASFSARDPTPVYEYASLIIDDISIESIRNPPKSILNLQR